MSATAELKARATLDNKQWLAASGQMENSVNKMATGALSDLTGMLGGAFAAGAIVNFGKALMHEASQLERFSKTVGISAGMLNKLGDIAEKTGADSEGFQQKIVKMLEAQEKAAAGDDKLREAFERLGVSIEQLTDSTPEQLLEAIAQGAEKDATSIKDLNAVMGKGAAAEYGDALNRIATEGMPAVSEAANDAIRRLAELNARFSSLWNEVKQAGMKTVVAAVDTRHYRNAIGQFFAGNRGAALASLGLGVAGSIEQKKDDEEKKKIADTRSKSMAEQRLAGLKTADEGSTETAMASKAGQGFQGYGRMVGGAISTGGSAESQQLEETKTQTKVLEEGQELIKQVISQVVKMTSGE